MTRQTVDPIALHLALRRIVAREAARRRRRTRSCCWLSLFRPRFCREHLARLSPTEIVHSNLAS